MDACRPCGSALTSSVKRRSHVGEGEIRWEALTPFDLQWHWLHSFAIDHQTLL